jgi:Lipocalin-like domain
VEDIRERARRALVGAWEVVTFDDRPNEGDDWTATYGRSPTGVIVYDASGTVATILPAAGSVDEVVAYYGTFRVTEAEADADALRGVVEHHMEIASPSWLLDEEPPRAFELTGDRLVLGDQRTARRVLERRRPS